MKKTYLTPELHMVRQPVQRLMEISAVTEDDQKGVYFNSSTNVTNTDGEEL